MLHVEQYSLLEPEGSRYIEKGESVKDEEKINRDIENIPEVANSEGTRFKWKCQKSVINHL